MTQANVCNGLKQIHGLLEHVLYSNKRGVFAKLKLRCDSTFKQCTGYFERK